ncbi:MAG: hypothetical protein QXM27_02495 [Candidatus Pacearchaeota archaeon]
MKKGQLTIFIIIAIILISIIFIIFYIRKEQSSKLEKEINLINNYINFCLEKKSENIIIEIAKNGGYYKFEKNYINFLNENGVFYLKENNSYVPNKTFVENQINLWLNDEFDECLKIENKNIIKKYCNIKTELNNITKINFDCDINFFINEKIYRLKKFEVNLNISLIPFINASKEIVDIYNNTIPGYICIECLNEIGEKYNLNITVIPITKEIYELEHVWFLLNSSQKINNKFLIWRFVTEIK